MPAPIQKYEANKTFTIHLGPATKQKTVVYKPVNDQRQMQKAHEAVAVAEQQAWNSMTPWFFAIGIVAAISGIVGRKQREERAYQMSYARERGRLAAREKHKAENR